MDLAVNERIELLESKYNQTNQNINCYLDGLYYSGYLKYWDYIQLETLLSLQRPKTEMHDEVIFIVYHQIVELYFKLIIKEIEVMTSLEDPCPDRFLKGLQNINRYYRSLVGSMDIMSEGIDQQEFLKFRNALAPASGFQSVQYRIIDFMCTSSENLVSYDKREELRDTEDLESLYQAIYWKDGGKENGKPSLTADQFNEAYDELLLDTARSYQRINLWELFKTAYFRSSNSALIIDELKKLDTQSNVLWPMGHYKSAAKHLIQKDIKATGGTNWRKYLPPRFQRVIYFPELWTVQEREEWGIQLATELTR